MGKKYLVVVEAPNKVKKVSEYFNKADPKNEYVVEASVGHIMDLDPSCMSIDLDTFTPEYVVSSDKKDVVKKLKKQAESCDDVILASDSDAEGCAIAWSVAQVLKLKNPQRVLYQEITEKAIKEALKNPVPIDMDLFHSQQGRRMLDRIIGYKISPILWKVLAGAKSSGRVQSVTVRMICEKENEIEKFFDKEQSSYFRTIADFNNKYKSVLYTTKEQGKLDDEEWDEDEDNIKKKKGKKEEKEEKEDKKNKKLQAARINDENEMKQVLKDVSKSAFKISNISEKETLRSAPPPYTTDSLIQDAHRKLGFSTQRTTSAAQNLYAAGYITYIRTDSPNISESALEEIKKMVILEYGEEYHRQQQYKSKAANAQCAHECIRPTKIENTSVPKKEKCGNDETMLYRMIWRRTMASQMAQAKFKITTIEIDISKLKEYKFVSEHDICIFSGFLAVYNPEKNEDDQEGEEEDKNKKDKKLKLPKIGDEMDISDVISSLEYKKPPVRYDDGSIIGKMKKIGIGRPSTYNSIIKKIQDANYVSIQNNSGVEKKSIILKLDDDGKIKEEIKTILLGKDIKKCVPTEMGKAVNDFLMKNFPEIMDYKFTADMEELLDKISEGKLLHVNMLKDFYKDFDPLITKLNENAKGGVISLKNMTELGEHPESGHKIYTLMAKFGPIVQMLDVNNKIINTAPIKAPLKKNTITIEDAVKLFEYPKTLGKNGRSSIILYRGQYGFYLKIGDDKLPLKLTEEEAKEYTLDDAKKRIKENEEKQEENKKNLLWHGKDKVYEYSVNEGKYGKYIMSKSIKNKKQKATFCKLPSNIKIESLTVEKVCEIIKESCSNKFKKKDKNEKSDKTEKKTNDTNDDEKKEKILKKIEKKPKEKAVPKKSKKEVGEELDDVFELKKSKVSKVKKIEKIEKVKKEVKKEEKVKKEVKKEEKVKKEDKKEEKVKKEKKGG